MNQSEYIFSQLVEFLNYDRFSYIVQKYNVDKGNRGLSCWNQLLMMLFGQLSNRDSLRDLMTIIEALKSKANHLGFARANASRDYRIFEEFLRCISLMKKEVSIFLTVDIIVLATCTGYISGNR